MATAGMFSLYSALRLRNKGLAQVRRKISSPTMPHLIKVSTRHKIACGMLVEKQQATS